MTAEQRKALEDYAFLKQAEGLLNREAEAILACRRDRGSEIDAISAVAADVHEEADAALDRLLKSFGMER